MIILTTDTESQAFRFIPRNGNISRVVFRDEEQRTENDLIDWTISEGEWFNLFSYAFSLKEKKDYLITMLDENEDVLYESKVFCTNQVPEVYKTINQLFQSNESSNQFIVINE